MFYCSRKCQILDWKQHKTFCRKDEEKIATARREKCLDIIKSQHWAIFQYLFVSLYGDSKYFLHVSKTHSDSEEDFIVISTSIDSEYHLDQIMDPKLSNSGLYHVVDQIQKMITEKVPPQIKYDGFDKALIVDIETRAIPVLYEEDDDYFVYVLGSPEIAELGNSIRKMPSILKDRVIDELYEREDAYSKELCWRIQKKS